MIKFSHIYIYLGNGRDAWTINSEECWFNPIHCSYKTAAHANLPPKNGWLFNPLQIIVGCGIPVMMSCGLNLLNIFFEPYLEYKIIKNNGGPPFVNEMER